MSFKRKLKRIWFKATHERRPPEFIARGWAIGVCVGFAVPFGFQLYIALPLSYFLKGSKIGATIGTFVTNHVTIFFIYPFQCWLGSRLLGNALSYDFIDAKIASILGAETMIEAWRSLLSLGCSLLTGFFIGGFLFALVSTPLAYFIVKSIIIVLRRRRDICVEKRRRNDTGE